MQRYGFDVVYSDLDVVWLRNPLPYLSRFLSPDVLMSVDSVSTANVAGDDGLEQGVTASNYMNTGEERGSEEWPLISSGARQVRM